jgi:hypothetical protein
MRILLALVLGATLLFYLPPGVAQASRGGHSSHSSSGTTHVRGYVRKDGTYVHPHERRLPSSSAPRQSLGHSTSPRHYASRSRLHDTYRDHWSYNDSGKLTHRSSAHAPGGFYGLQRDGHGHIKRSEEAKHAFMRQHPCPATGRSSGPCPGYVIDHVKALKHGGADDPNNMQWQTVQQAKEKDRWE